MPFINLRLPGHGDATTLFEFDPAQALPQQLMNLPTLGDTQDSEQRPNQIERWQAAGPVSHETQRLPLGELRRAWTKHYQVLSLNIDLSQYGQSDNLRDKVRTSSAFAYQRLLKQVSQSPQSRLLRCWNYVPNINLGDGDDEVYRHFCTGRAEAFADSDLALPAATAIGSHDGWLRISLLSTSADTAIQHIENPRQVSAFAYPRQYGPHSPSFARATWFCRDDEHMLLLSGTSSIVAHETQHAGQLAEQTAETRHNIDALLANANQVVPANSKLTPQSIRLYLRCAEQQQLASQAYQANFPEFPSSPILHADICRADLSMEIEGVFVGSHQL